MPRLAYAVLAALIPLTAASRAGASPAPGSPAGAVPGQISPPPRVTVEVGGEAGFDLELRTGLAATVGVRPWRHPVWLRAKLGRGHHTPDQVGGDYVAAALGVEGQWCTASGVACAFAGLDAGAFRMAWDPDDDSIVVDNNGGRPYQRPTEWVPALMPRIGFDFGPRQVHVRLTAQGLAHAEGGFPVGLTVGASLVARI